MSIFNPAVFIGEAVPGSTPGAPLSADSNGNLISGIVSGEAQASTTATATTSNALVSGMTSGALDAGTYLALYSADVNSSTSGIVVTIQFAISATNYGPSQRKFMPFAGGTLTAGSQRVPVAFQSLLTLTAGQTIDVRWSTSSGTVTSAVRQLTWIRII